MKELNYKFKRKSSNYFEWLLNRVQNVNYHLAESVIVDEDNNQTL